MEEGKTGSSEWLAVSALASSLEVIWIPHESLIQWATPQFSISHTREAPLSTLFEVSIRFLRNKFFCLKREAQISEVTQSKALVTPWSHAWTLAMAILVQRLEVRGDGTVRSQASSHKKFICFPTLSSPSPSSTLILIVLNLRRK